MPIPLSTQCGNRTIVWNDPLGSFIDTVGFLHGSVEGGAGIFPNGRTVGEGGSGGLLPVWGEGVEWVGGGWSWSGGWGGCGGGEGIELVGHCIMCGPGDWLKKKRKKRAHLVIANTSNIYII